MKHYDELLRHYDAESKAGQEAKQRYEAELVAIEAKLESLWNALGCGHSRCVDVSIAKSKKEHPPSGTATLKSPSGKVLASVEFTLPADESGAVVLRLGDNPPYVFPDGTELPAVVVHAFAAAFRADISRKLRYSPPTT
jgi:hypothetical protein